MFKHFLNLQMPSKLSAVYFCLFNNVLLIQTIEEKYLPSNANKNPSIRDKIIFKIFENYKNHERPTEESLRPTIVYVNMHILAIHSIDVLNMAYNVDFYLRQEWVDQRLAWSHHEIFQNYTRPISISSMLDRLWLPDLFFRNSKEGVMYKMTIPNFLLRLESKGELLYSQKITMKFSCQMHLSNFPMDSQQCDINIGSYGYTFDDLKFEWKANESVTQSQDIQISEFYTPIEVRTMDCTENSKTSTGTYSCLKLLFSMKRQLSCYIVSTYIPAILIVMVSWLSFWISVEAVPARVTLGLLTLLGILTQNKGVSGNLPKVSYIKAIDIYVIACIIFIIGAFTEFAIASNCIRRRRWCILNKHVRKPINNRKEYFEVNRKMNVEYEIINKDESMFTDKAVPRKRKRVKSYFSSKPVVKTNSGQTCTIVTLESRPRSTRPIHLRKQFAVLSNPDMSEEEVLKRLLSTNCSYENLVISNDNEIIGDQEIYETVSTEGIDRDTLKDFKAYDNNNSNEDIWIDSDLDSYSRFLFPAFFLLYNCVYWLYYLVIA